MAWLCSRYHWNVEVLSNGKQNLVHSSQTENLSSLTAWVWRKLFSVQSRNCLDQGCQWSLKSKPEGSSGLLSFHHLELVINSFHPLLVSMPCTSLALFIPHKEINPQFSVAAKGGTLTKPLSPQELPTTSHLHSHVLWFPTKVGLFTSICGWTPF